MATPFLFEIMYFCVSTAPLTGWNLLGAFLVLEIIRKEIVVNNHNLIVESCDKYFEKLEGFNTLSGEFS